MARRSAALARALRAALPPIAGAAILLASCGMDERADGSADAFRVRDSAGIPIAENAAPRWTEGEGWSLSAEPVVEIGTVGGGAAAFTEIEGVMLLGRGGVAAGSVARVVVADRRTAELRYFDAAGEFVHRAGGEGDGPGEFRDIGALHRYRGDSLAVWDRRRRDWTILDASTGAFGRVVRPEESDEGVRALAGFVRSLGALDDGSWVVGDRDLRLSREPTMTYETMLRMAPDGRFSDSLGRFPDVRRFVTAVETDLLLREIFSRRGVSAIDRDGFYTATSDRHELRFHDRTGAVRRIVRWAGAEPPPVSDADVEAYVAERLAREPASTRGLIAAALADAPAADRFPAFESALVDADGHVWLAAFPRPGDDGPRRWTVLDPEGRWLGMVAMPRGFEVHDVDGSRVAGVTRDELGVQYVRIHTLRVE